MKKILVLLLLIIYPANAEKVTATGKYKHLGDKTKNQSCKIAEELMNQRPLLENSVKLRQNPNVVFEWISRAEIFENNGITPYQNTIIF